MNQICQIIPIFKTADMTAGLSFYIDKLAFERVGYFEFGPGGPAYASLLRGGCELHLSAFPGDGAGPSVAYIHVADIARLQAELIQRGGAPEDTEILDQSWGTREIYVSDPDENRLRFGQRGQGLGAGGETKLLAPARPSPIFPRGVPQERPSGVTLSDALIR